MARRSGRLDPVLQRQRRHALELADVVADQREAERAGLGGDPEIVVADHAATALQLGKDLAVVLACCLVERQYGNQLAQARQGGEHGLTLHALLGAVAELAPGHDRHADFAGREPLETGQHGRWPRLGDVDADVGVEQVAQGHGSELVARLRRQVVATLAHEIRRQGRQQLEGFRQAGRLLAQDDLVAATQDFHLVHVELELLGQAHGLRVTAFENPGGGHGRLRKYIKYIRAFR